ncbi:DUF2188 domain-containing protein [Cupriavidus sp. SIMBA_020]|uniref:DUF2188 domain-containing protein n=1 Tax=Cupriavidus sp. SIMBA_020 TaxID=3085766 RepID=UPI00397E3725
MYGLSYLASKSAHVLLKRRWRVARKKEHLVSRSGMMPTRTVEVFQSQHGRWMVKSDGDDEKSTYPSRTDAIAAGVHRAMADDAVLLIHGADSTESRLDFSGSSSPS